MTSKKQITGNKCEDNEEKQIIFSHEFKKEMKLEVKEGELVIGDVQIGYDHDQDCCECVYADFSVFKHYIEDINEMGIGKIEIKLIEDMGFVIFFYEKPSCYEKRIGVLVNCYNEQNDYYSDNLELIIRQNDTTKKIDISEVVYDMIC